MRLIDADKLQEFPIRATRCDKEHANTHFINGIESVMEYAELLPTVDAVPVVHGRWEYIQQTLTTLSQLRCSFCGWWSLDPSIDGAYNYCPNCGAKMDGGDNNEADPTANGRTVKPMLDDCKWMQDEVCVNADCPACADYCPVADTPGVCKYEERGNSDAQKGKRQTGAK